MDDLEKILRNAEQGVLEQYIDCFKGYGITLTIEPGVLHDIAAMAHAEKTGARGLLTVLERLFRDFKFELPGTTVTHLELNRRMLQDPAGYLRELLENAQDDEAHQLVRNQAEGFARRFRDETGLELSFTRDAIDYLVGQTKAEGAKTRDFLESRLVDFRHALPLAARHGGAGKRGHTIDAECLRDPNAYLSQTIRDSFQAARQDTP